VRLEEETVVTRSSRLGKKAKERRRDDCLMLMFDREALLAEDLASSYRNMLEGMPLSCLPLPLRPWFVLPALAGSECIVSPNRAEAARGRRSLSRHSQKIR
jgi:hypothetical protein